MAGAPEDRKETCLQTLPLLPVNQLGEKGKELERGGAALGCTKGLSIFLFILKAGVHVSLPACVHANSARGPPPGEQSPGPPSTVSAPWGQDATRQATREAVSPLRMGDTSQLGLDAVVETDSGKGVVGKGRQGC